MRSAEILEYNRQQKEKEQGTPCEHIRSCGCPRNASLRFRLVSAVYLSFQNTNDLRLKLTWRRCPRPPTWSFDLLIAATTQLRFSDPEILILPAGCR